MSALPRAEAGPSASAAGDTIVLAMVFGVLLAIAVRIYPKLAE